MKTFFWQMVPFLVAFSIVPQTSYAQKEKTGIIEFTPPKGWTKTVNQNGNVKLSKVDQTTGKSCDIVVQGDWGPSNNNPARDFSDNWKFVAQLWKVASTPKELQSQVKDGWTITQGVSPLEGTFQSEVKEQAYVLLSVVSGFGKATRILAIFDDQSYMTQLNAFFAGLSFDKRAPAAPPTTAQNSNAGGEAKQPRSNSVKGAGIVGVWQGVSLSVGMTSIGAPLGARYKVFSAIFLSNGQAYFGPNPPTQGLDGLNTRILAERNPRDWGTYNFSDGKGSLKLPYANIPLRMDGDKLIITPNHTDHRFVKLNSVNGATVNKTAPVAARATGQESMSSLHGQSKRSTNPRGAPVATINAGVLVIEFERNEVRANQVYGGKRVRVSGTVNSIEMLKDGRISLTFHSPALGYAMTRCYFDNSESSRLAELKGGREAIVEGTVRGLGGGLNGRGFVEMENGIVP